MRVDLKSRKVAWLILPMMAVSMIRCGGATDSSGGGGGDQKVTTDEPFDNYTPPADQDDFRLMTLSTARAATVPAASDWDLTSTDAITTAPIGEWSYSSGVVSFDKADLTGCASGTAPNCTYGNGVGQIRPADWNFYPGSDFTYKWGDLVRISSRVEMVASTSQNAIFDCGFTFGFGSVGAHSSATNSYLNLTLPGRSAGVDDEADHFRILYRSNVTAGNIAIDSPISDPTSGAPWNLASWGAAQGFNMQTGTLLSGNGETLIFDWQMDFDHSAREMTITLTPVSSTMASPGLQTQSVVWEFGNTFSGFGNAGGAVGLGVENFPSGYDTWEEFNEADVMLGFLVNFFPKSCKFSDLAVSLSP